MTIRRRRRVDQRLPHLRMRRGLVLEIPGLHACKRLVHVVRVELGLTSPLTVSDLDDGKQVRSEAFGIATCDTGAT